MKNKISIIIPVYNVEDYLEKCIESVINQTYTNLEIILVDDGSTDNSGSICDYYKEKDNRIIVIHKGNGGLSSARNAGLKIATGDYISFIDSDDWIELNAFEILMHTILYDTDIIQFGYQSVSNDKIIRDFNIENKIIKKNNEVLDSYFNTHLINEIVWNKLFKANLFNKTVFIEGKNNEDYMIMPEILMKANKFIIIDSILYNYRQRENSIMSEVFSEKKMDRIFAGQYVIDFCNKYMTEYINYAKVNLCYICIYLYSQLLKSDIVNSQNYADTINKVFKENYKDITKCKEINAINFFRRMWLKLASINIKLASFIYNIYQKKN